MYKLSIGLTVAGVDRFGFLLYLCAGRNGCDGQWNSDPESSRADALVAGQKTQGKADSPEMRKSVKEELVRREILSQEAVKLGMDLDTTIQGQMDLAEQGVLTGAYLNEYAKTLPAGDKATKKKRVQSHIEELRRNASVR
jgi:hypothetical protein